MPNWKPEVDVEGNWSHNALVFATKEEAEENARDLFMRWTTTNGWRAVMTNDPVNYRYVGGKLEPIESCSTS